MSQDWDINSYKSEHENEEHWELKKRFMLAHKDKFPEDELVCLAQVFTNIEFMGCRYPDKTMIRVAELAKGVVEKYREARKNSLKRTFVAASDAASAKVKGQVCKVDQTNSTNSTNLTNSTKSKKKKKKRSKKMKFVKEINKNPSTSEVVTLDNDNGTLSQSKKPKNPKYEGLKTSIAKPNHVKAGPANKIKEAKFVLFFDYQQCHPVNVINKSSVVNKCNLRWETEKTTEPLKVCNLYIDEMCVGTGVGASVKSSKEIAAMTAITNLQKTCYSIKAKVPFFSDTTINSSLLGCAPEYNNFKALDENNIGRKMLKMMGWEGGGLGRSGQGIQEPVTAGLHVRRSGFGNRKDSFNIHEFKSKASEFVWTWMNSDSDQDLVFSSEFNSDERKVLHEIASMFALRSRSHGKEPNRRLVISRKSDPWELVQHLLKSGSSSDKYELIHPTGN